MITTDIAQHIINHVGEIILTLDGQQRVCSFNQSAQNFFPELSQHLIGQPLTELIAAELIEPVHQIQANEFKPDCFESHYVKSGKSHTVSWSLLSHLDQENNQTITLLGRDITDERTSSRLLKEMRETLDSTIEVIPGYYWSKDLAGRYTSCNAELARLIGVKSREVLGRTDYEMPWVESAESLREHDQIVVQTGKTCYFEEYVPVDEESKYTLYAAKAPLRDAQGTIIGTVGTSIDISTHKQIQRELIEAKEQAELSNKAKSEFLSNMRHDIRTPFTGILSLAEFLERQEEDASKREHLAIISHSARSALEYLNSIIEAINLGHGDDSTASYQSSFNLRDMLREIESLMAAVLMDKKLDFIIDYAESLPEKFIGNHYALQKIILNLVSNGVKFTEHGFIAVRVSVEEPITHEPCTVNITIEDSGIGIAADQLKLIFDKFYRVTSSYSSKYHGSGLGLYAVQLLLDKLGGKISVESSEGKGSKFICRIPLLVNEEADLTAVAAAMAR